MQKAENMHLKLDFRAILFSKTVEFQSNLKIGHRSSYTFEYANYQYNISKELAARLKSCMGFWCEFTCPYIDLIYGSAIEI